MKRYYPYKKYKKAYFDKLTRNLWGDYDENGVYIPWRFIIWSVKYGVSSSKYTKKDGKGIISFINKDIFEKYIKPWVCMTKSEHRKMREMGLDYSTIVKLALKGAKMQYEIYLWKKYKYDKSFK